MGKASGNISIAITLIGSSCLEKMSPLDETETTSILSFVARDPCGALTAIFFFADVFFSYDRLCQKGGTARNLDGTFLLSPSPKNFVLIAVEKNCHESKFYKYINKET